MGTQFLLVQSPNARNNIAAQNCWSREGMSLVLDGIVTDLKKSFVAELKTQK